MTHTDPNNIHTKTNSQNRCRMKSKFQLQQTHQASEQAKVDNQPRDRQQTTKSTEATLQLQYSNHIIHDTHIHTHTRLLIPVEG